MSNTTKPTRAFEPIIDEPAVIPLEPDHPDFCLPAFCGLRLEDRRYRHSDGQVDGSLRWKGTHRGAAHVLDTDFGTLFETFLSLDPDAYEDIRGEIRVVDPEDGASESHFLTADEMERLARDLLDTARAI